MHGAYYVPYDLNRLVNLAKVGKISDNKTGLPKKNCVRFQCGAKKAIAKMFTFAFLFLCLLEF